MKRRCDSENDSGQERNAECPQQHRHIQTDSLKTGEIARTDRNQRFDSEPCETKSKQTSDQRQSKLSVNSCRVMRTRRAPNAARNAISFSREVACDKSRRSE